MTQLSRSAASRTASRKSSRNDQFGPQCNASSSTCRTPNRFASRHANVLLPEQLVPTTTTRVSIDCCTMLGLPKVPGFSCKARAIARATSDHVRGSFQLEVLTKHRNRLKALRPQSPMMRAQAQLERRPAAKAVWHVAPGEDRERTPKPNRSRLNSTAQR